VLQNRPDDDAYDPNLKQLGNEFKADTRLS
jgi:hypothetical protein